MLNDLLAAMSADTGFFIGWKRARHLRNGHPHDLGTLVEKLHSRNHPYNQGDYVYTVNIMRCEDCGLYFHDAGMEYVAANLKGEAMPTTDKGM